MTTGSENQLDRLSTLGALVATRRGPLILTLA